jgi:hypothetical protein
VKFDGNKSKFAKASSCSETTIRRVFRNKQRMTVDLLLQFCFSLEILFQPFFKIALGRTMWNVVDVIASMG